MKGVELGRKWKPYDWAPLCYPQWWTDPVDRTKLTYTREADDVTYADAYREIVLNWEMKAGALGEGWRAFPVGLSDQEGHALLMEYLRRRKAKKAADKAPPEGPGRATTDAGLASPDDATSSTARATLKIQVPEADPCREKPLTVSPGTPSLEAGSLPATAVPTDQTAVPRDPPSQATRMVIQHYRHEDGRVMFLMGVPPLGPSPPGYGS